MKAISGCFNLFLPGHMELINAAIAYRQDLELVAVVNSDESVMKLKGRVILTDDEKYTLLLSIPGISRVFIYDSMPEAIRALEPKVWIKGTDWAGRMPEEDMAAIEEVGCEIAYIGQKVGPGTSEVIRRIKGE